MNKSKIDHNIFEHQIIPELEHLKVYFRNLNFMKSLQAVIFLEKMMEYELSETKSVQRIKK